jgi:hypothetical protein
LTEKALVAPAWSKPEYEHLRTICRCNGWWLASRQILHYKLNDLEWDIKNLTKNTTIRPACSFKHSQQLKLSEKICGHRLKENNSR